MPSSLKDLTTLLQTLLTYLVPSTHTTGSKTVTTAGTREQMPNQPCKEVLITAEADNTGYVYIGDEYVSSTRFTKKILAGEEFSMSIDNLNKIWLDVGTSTDGITYGFLL